VSVKDYASVHGIADLVLVNRYVPRFRSTRFCQIEKRWGGGVCSSGGMEGSALVEVGVATKCRRFERVGADGSRTDARERSFADSFVCSECSWVRGASGFESDGARRNSNVRAITGW